MVMKTSRNGLQLSKFSESPGGVPQLVAYPCSAKTWTIAHGHTKGVTKGMTCTPGQAEIWFQQDIEEAENIVRAIVRENVSQGVFDALVSFAFNFGYKKFMSFSLPKMINELAARKPTEAKWMEYIYSIRDDDGDGDMDACIDRGLVIRRIREILLGRGFSWKVTEAAANTSNIHPEKEERPWDNRDGFKEFLTNGDALLSESVDRARSLAAFFDEPDDRVAQAPAPKPKASAKPEPEPVLILDKPLPMEAKVPRQMTLPDEWDKMTEKQQVAWLNTGEFIALGGKVGEPIKPAPLPEAAKAPASVVISKKEVALPKYDPNKPLKDIKDSTTARGLVKVVSGKEIAATGAGAGAILAYTIPYSNQIASFIDKFPAETIVKAFVVLFGLMAVYGVWRAVIGGKIMEYGRENAEGPKG